MSEVFGSMEVNKIMGNNLQVLFERVLLHQKDIVKHSFEN